VQNSKKSGSQRGASNEPKESSSQIVIPKKKKRDWEDKKGAAASHVQGRNQTRMTSVITCLRGKGSESENATKKAYKRKENGGHLPPVGRRKDKKTRETNRGIDRKCKGGLQALRTAAALSAFLENNQSN